MLKRRLGEFVFERDGLRIGEFYKSWRSACKRAELPGLLLHDLRRAAVGNMVRAGIYDIVNDRDLVEAAAKLDCYIEHSLGTADASK